MLSLFREEAVANRAASVFGGIVIGSGRTDTVLCFTVVALAACLVLLLTYGTYSRKEHATGYLVPGAGLVEIFSPRVGHIARLGVTEGEIVRVGTLLFRVASPREAASGLDLDKSRIARLKEERSVVESQIAKEQSLAAIRKNNDKRRVETFRRQLAGVMEQRDDMRTRLEILHRNLARLKTLRKEGNLAPSLLDTRTAELLQARRETYSLDAEVERIKGEIADLRTDIAKIPLHLEVRRGELDARVLQLQRSIDQSEAEQSAVVRAPLSGRVTAVMVHAGMSVTRQHRLMVIVPLGSALRAELLVPARAIGFVRPGQVVELRYDAFPYQKFGLFQGRIRSVSHTVLNPEDQIGPVRLSGPAYRVVADLDSQAIAAYGNRVPLQPGLTLKADIIRDRRSILEWIFDPLIAAAKEI